MKDMQRYFARPYSSVRNTGDHRHDDDEDHLTIAAHVGDHLPVALQQSANLLDAQQKRNSKYMVLAKDNMTAGSGREKSFKSVGGGMNPAGILSSFFNERQQNKRARSPKCAFLLLAIGVLAITTAVLVKIIQPYDMIFKWKLTMSEGGEIFNLWEKPPVDLYIKIYLFNITNAHAFLAGHERMHVEQVGPYVYKELMTHENVTFNENGTMSTTPAHPLVWQEHLSEGNKEDDQVVMLNIAMLAIAHMTAKKSYFLRMGLNTLFLTSNSQPIVRMTAREFMFGFGSPLTALGNTFLPGWISFDKVGLIDRMYDFGSDFETFHTGVSNPSISGLYDTYRGATDLPHWNGSHCSNIEMASDGTKFASFIKPDQSVKFFRKSMCRPINLNRIGEAEQHGSLTGYRYVFEENAFDNGAINPANKCFCRQGHCQPQGLIDVSDCYYGFPISLSYPHFMNGDEGLQRNITGLRPDADTHSSAFVIQPESGLPLSISAKVQINMHFNDMSAYSQVERFSERTVPMLWFDITMPKLPAALDSRFNFYLNILPYLDILGFWGGLALGVALLVYAVTRATIRMSTFAQAGGISTQHNGNDKTTPFLGGGMYSNGLSRGGVYNPCEMTVLQTLNEKGTVIEQIIGLPTSAMKKLTTEGERKRADVASVDGACVQVDVDELDLDEEEHAMMYTEMMVQRKSFALELEPAISDVASSSDEDDEEEAERKRKLERDGDVDEGLASDTSAADAGTLTMSRNSTASSSTDDEDLDGRRQFRLPQHARHLHGLTSAAGADECASSIGSSGIASSYTDSQDGRLSSPLTAATSLAKYDQRPQSTAFSSWSVNKMTAPVMAVNNTTNATSFQAGSAGKAASPQTRRVHEV